MVPDSLRVPTMTSSSPTNSVRGRLGYRPEVDGLRAIAVVPVILFHAGFNWFSGGYVGVDVFFVISGYLITAIIVGERSEGTFTIARFLRAPRATHPCLR